MTEHVMKMLRKRHVKYLLLKGTSNFENRNYNSAKSDTQKRGLPLQAAGRLLFLSSLDSARHCFISPRVSYPVPVTDI